MSWKLRAAVSALLLAPQAAFALGLGDIRLSSALNEPLSAEIELVAPSAEELGSLSAQLASRELFQRYGLERPAYLDSVQFRVGRGKDGRNVLLVNSSAAIGEPFVTFLVEVNWPRGRLLREYTVLLDPPVFAPREAAPPAPVAAPRTERPATAPVSEPAEAAPRPEAAAQRPAVEPAGGDQPSTYRVQSGDTLYGVASQYTDGGRTNTNRMMIAMFRGNPGAFGGNINLLRAGSILRVPGAEALAEVSAAEAASEIGRQTTAWQGGAAGQEPERLRLVTPTEAAPESGAAAPATADVDSRIEQLNREIAESQRLLELKNAELAKLQQRLTEQGAAAPAEAEAPAAGPEAAAPAPTEAEAPAPVEAPAKPKAAPAEVAPEPSFIDRLADSWQYVLGAVALLLGGGLAFGYARRRREDDLDEAIRSFEPAPTAPLPTETQRLRTLPAGLTTATEQQEADDFHTATLPPSGRTAEEHGARFDETISSETAPELDRGDPLAEADFHMAYGLYDQASDIVKLALEREPGRRDYVMKLLEIYFVSGDKQRFLRAARDFAATRREGDAGDWDRVLIMGRQLAPEDSLFTGPAPRGAVDLNLEGVDSIVDLELLAPPEGDAGVDLDLGEGLESGDLRAATGGTGFVDFDLDSADQGLSPTAEMPAHGGGVTTSPTAEMPAMYSPTIEATRLQPVSADTTAEMPMDDLGIDLGDLDALVDAGAEDDITRIAPSADTTQLLPAGRPEMDFDLSDLTAELAIPPDIDETQKIDIDVGGPISDHVVDLGATEQMTIPDLPHMSQLEPITLSEVGTKLDLARAYVDMGDPDGARSILDEVLKEGSASQKQEAQRLLDSLPSA
jgi:pilus assembly protein FimV